MINVGWDSTVQRVLTAFTIHSLNPDTGLDFPQLSTLALGYTQPSVQCVPIMLPCGKVARV
jgi:hypothetical protein